jgi:hypothetical protein
MQPPADAPAADLVADSELDTHAHSDVSPAEPVPAEREPAAPAQRKPAEQIPAESGPAEPGLTEREQRILAFERQWWRHAGAKEQAIRDTFELSATRYYQVLNNLLDNPAALASDPVLVGRLRRLRTMRARSRRR